MGEVQHRGRSEEMGFDTSSTEDEREVEELMVADQIEDRSEVVQEGGRDEEGTTSIIWEDSRGTYGEFTKEELVMAHEFSYSTDVEIIGLYNPESDAEKSTSLSDGIRMRSCFNCGSPDHQLPSCQEPRNAQVIALNRSLLRDYKLEAGYEDSDQPCHGLRAFEVLLWTKQRLDWLDGFQPGKIVGSTLRNALGLNESNSHYKEERLPWFDGGNAEGSCGGMLFWGYPPGYYSESDPKEAMRSRILGRDLENEPGESFQLTIHNDNAEDEEVVELMDRQCRVVPGPALNVATPRRWATYQTTLFSSDMLPVSNVDCPLPPIKRSPTPPQTQTHRGTFTDDRKALWAKLIAGDTSERRENPTVSLQLSQVPWRLHDAFDFRPRFPADYKPPQSSDPKHKGYGNSGGGHNVRHQDRLRSSGTVELPTRPGRGPGKPMSFASTAVVNRSPVVTTSREDSVEAEDMDLSD